MYFNSGEVTTSFLEPMELESSLLSISFRFDPPALERSCVDSLENSRLLSLSRVASVSWMLA